MEKRNTKDNNKKKYKLITRFIPFCNFKTNQKNLTKDKQLNDGTYISSTERFCKSSSTVLVERGVNKSRPEHSFKKVEKNLSTLPTLLPGREKAKMHFSELKNKFINLLMRDGEKSKAYKLFADSLKQIEEKEALFSFQKTKKEVFDFFTERKKHLYSLDQKQHKQTKEKKNKRAKISHRVEQDYYNVFILNNILYQAVENVKPALETRRVRKGGTTYQVPAIVSQKRQERVAIKWIIEAAEKKKKKNKDCFSHCLVKEIMDAFNKTGQPRQRRDEQLKVAQFNRAYTLYRWW